MKYLKSAALILVVTLSVFGASHVFHQFGDGSKASTVQIETKRVTMASLGIGLTANVTVTWDMAFSDSNYTVSVAGEAAGVTLLSIQDITARTPTSCTFAVKNIGLSAATPVIHAVAIHD